MRRKHLYGLSTVVGCLLAYGIGVWLSGIDSTWTSESRHSTAPGKVEWALRTSPHRVSFTVSGVWQGSMWVYTTDGCEYVEEPPPSRSLPWWSHWSDSEARSFWGDRFYPMFGEVAAGWPIATAKYRWVATQGGKHLVIDNGLGRQESHQSTMALRIWPPHARGWIPVWPGILLSGLLVTGVFAVTIEGWWALRSRIRRLRRQCVRCAYPVAPDALAPCPECGHPTI